MYDKGDVTVALERLLSFRDVFQGSTHSQGTLRERRTPSGVVYVVIPVGGEIALVAISLSIVAIVPTIVAALVGDLSGKIMGYLTMFFLVMIVAPLTYLKVKSFGFWELLTLDLTASSCSLAILRISTSGLGFDVGSIVAISNLSFGVALLVAAIMGGWK